MPKAAAAGPERPQIIKLIIDMIEKGQPEDAIVSTLTELGIKPEEARKLLMFAEKDVYSLLLSDINSVVKEQVGAQQEAINRAIADTVRTYSEEQIGQVRADLDKRFATQKSAAEQRLKEFGDSFKQDERRIDLLETMATELKSDMARVAFGGGTIERRALSALLIIAGVGVLGYALLQFANYLQAAAQPLNFLIVSVAIAIIGAVILVAGIYTRE